MRGKITSSFAVAAVASALAWGCGGGGGHGGGGFLPDPMAPVSGTAQGTAAATALAVQATLAAIDTSFPALTGTSPAVTKTGTATNGSVRLDFGTSTIVDDATFSGALVTSYSIAVLNSGQGTGTLSIDFSAFHFSTKTLGNTSTSGTLVVTQFSWNGPQQAAGVSATPITLATSARGTFSVVPTSLAWAFSTTTEQQTFTETDNVTGSVGTWMVDLAQVVQTFVNANRAITAGTVAAESLPSLQNLTQPTLEAAFTFNAPNGGQLVLAPPGTVTTFSF